MYHYTYSLVMKCFYKIMKNKKKNGCLAWYTHDYNIYKTKHHEKMYPYFLSYWNFDFHRTGAVSPPSNHFQYSLTRYRRRWMKQYYQQLQHRTSTIMSCVVYFIYRKYLKMEIHQTDWDRLIMFNSVCLLYHHYVNHERHFQLPLSYFEFSLWINDFGYLFITYIIAPKL